MEAIKIVEMYYEYADNFEKYNLGLEDVIKLVKIVKEELEK
jgi:hypothetical protein